MSNIDFLSQDTFEELSRAYDTSESSEMAFSFAKAFLLKAKNQKDTMKILKGYERIVSGLFKTRSHSKAQTYLDSIIALTKNLNDFEQPAKAHMQKADAYGFETDYKKSMNQLIKANYYANKNGNTDQKYRIKYFIALLKINTGEYQEGLDLLKENLNYFKVRHKENNDYNAFYKQTLFSLSNQFNLLEQPDSALVYSKEAIAIAIKQNDNTLYGRLLLQAAFSQNLSKRYEASLDSLEKFNAYSIIEKSNVRTAVMANLIFGENYYASGKKNNALPYLKKVDSLAFTENFFSPEIIRSHKLLVDYYKNKDDQKQQIFYIDRLLYADSILDKDAIYLSRNIEEGYSKPNLIRQKQALITALEKKNDRSKTLLFLLLLTAVGLIVLLYYYFKKQRTYKKRFYDLLDKRSAPDESKFVVMVSDKPKAIDVSEDIINDVLEKLEVFEKKNGFLQVNLTVGNLAKQFDTNSKYFSKIINEYKGKSFTNYINDLRIDYAIVILKENLKLRKYSIKAVAKEVGFNTTEAFSKSFYKATGIYPSFYIKQLEKQ